MSVNQLVTDAEPIQLIDVRILIVKNRFRGSCL